MCQKQPGSKIENQLVTFHRMKYRVRAANPSGSIYNGATQLKWLVGCVLYASGLPVQVSNENVRLTFNDTVGNWLLGLVA